MDEWKRKARLQGEGAGREDWEIRGEKEEGLKKCLLAVAQGV